MKDRFKKAVILDLAIIFGSLVLSAGLFVLFQRAIIEKSSDIASGRRLIASKSMALENLSEFKRTLPEIREKREKIERLIADEDDLVGFSRFIDGVSRVHDVGLSFSFQGGPIQPQGIQPGHISVVLRLSGEYKNILNFIDDIENRSTQFMMNFDSVQINSSGNGYSAEIRGRIFFR